MAKHVFNLESIQDTVEVGEHTFIINMNDEKTRNFRQLAADYNEKAQKIAKIDVTKLDDAEIDDLNSEASDLLRNVLDNILGAGAYDKIYTTLGENTFHVAGFLMYLFELLEDKLAETKAQSKAIAAQQYTQKDKALDLAKQKAKRGARE